MAINLTSRSNADEDFIDMEVSSYSINSPPQNREFEFQMSSVSYEKETTTAPADELFYKGNLLPLHLPPRLQMVEKILQNSRTISMPSTTPSTNTSTPLDSCNISPSESCRVSCELNPDEYFFEWSTEISGFVYNHPKKSWSRRLMKIKQSLLGQKLKASRAYIKALFGKSNCSDLEGNASKAKECFSKYVKVAKRKESGEDGVVAHRRSFTGPIKRHSPKKCSTSSSSSFGSSSSASFSFNSNGFFELQLLKRSGSANLELEGSIEGAIAHCKRSHQLFGTERSANEGGLYSLSAPRIEVCGDKERTRHRSI